MTAHGVRRGLRGATGGASAVGAGSLPNGTRGTASRAVIGCGGAGWSSLMGWAAAAVNAGSTGGGATVATGAGADGSTGAGAGAGVAGRGAGSADEAGAEL